MNNVKKSLSVFLAVCVIMSVCAVSFVSFTSSYTVGGQQETEQKTYVFNFVDDATGESAYAGKYSSNNIFSRSDRSHAADYYCTEYAGKVKSRAEAGVGMYLYNDNGSKVAITDHNTKGSGQWKALIRDNDVNLGNTAGYFMIEAETEYDVTVTFKKGADILDTDNKVWGLGLGLTQNTHSIDYSGNDYTNATVLPDAYITGIAANDNETKTLKVTINGNGTSPSAYKAAEDGSGTNVVSEYSPNAGKIVCLIPKVTNAAGSAIANGTVIIEKVEVTVSKIVPYRTYVYDFVSEDSDGNIVSSYADTSIVGNNTLLSTNNAGADAAYRSYVDTTENATGMHLGNQSADGTKDILFKTTSGYGQRRMLIRDDDVNGGKWLRVEDGKTYAVIVKYKGGNGLSADSTYGLGIGLTNTATDANVGTAPTTSMLGDVLSYDSKIVFGDNGNWQYVAAVINADGVSRTTYDKTAEAWKTASNNGRYIVLSPESSVNASIFIESVTVYEKMNSSDEKLIVTQNADGSFTVDTAESGTALNKVDELNAYGEKAFGYAAVKGEDTEYITAVADNCVLCDSTPTYPTATMDSSFDVWNPNNCKAWSVVDSGDEAHGKVLQFSVTTAGSIGYDVSIRKQTVEVGKTYYVSMDAKILDTDIGTFTLRTTVSDQSGIGVSGGKAWASTQGTVSTNDLNNKTTEWQRIGFIYTPNSSLSYDYLPIGFGTAVGTGNVPYTLYIDNVNITAIDIVDENAKAGKRAVTLGSIRKAGSDNGNYVSAGLRFNGTLDDSVIADADDIGFAVLPTNMANAFNGNWFEAENWAASKAKYASCKDTIYSKADTTTSYQLILTGLSTEDGKTAYKTNFTAKMYVKSADGNYTYYDLSTTSYAEVKAAYRVYGTVSDSEWATF